MVLILLLVLGSKTVSNISGAKAIIEPAFLMNLIILFQLTVIPTYNSIKQRHAQKNLTIATKRVEPYKPIHCYGRFHRSHRLCRSAEQRFSFTSNTIEEKTFAGCGGTKANPTAAWELNCDDPDFSIWLQSM